MHTLNLSEAAMFDILDSYLFQEKMFLLLEA